MGHICIACDAPMLRVAQRDDEGGVVVYVCPRAHTIAFARRSQTMHWMDVAGYYDTVRGRMRRMCAQLLPPPLRSVGEAGLR